MIVGVVEIIGVASCVAANVIVMELFLELIKPFRVAVCNEESCLP